MKKFVFAVLAVMAMSVAAFAGSLEDAQVKELSKTGVADRITGNTILSNLALRIAYVGTSTEAIINVTSGAISAYAPFQTADASFGPSASSNTYQFADTAYDTLGELCDAIGATSNYNCTLLGAKRDDSSVLLINTEMARTTTDAKKSATSAGYGISFDTGVVSGAPPAPWITRLGITPGTGKNVILKSCIVRVNDTSGATFNVYGKLRKYEGVGDGLTRNDSTKVWGDATLVDDTGTTTTFSNNGAGGLAFAKDEHVVIEGMSADTAQSTSDYVSCFWDEK